MVDIISELSNALDRYYNAIKNTTSLEVKHTCFARAQGAYQLASALANGFVYSVVAELWVAFNHQISDVWEV